METQPHPLIYMLFMDIFLLQINHMAHKAENIYYTTLYGKSRPTLVSESWHSKRETHNYNSCFLKIIL